jgi:hypothetical protein
VIRKDENKSWALREKNKVLSIETGSISRRPEILVMSILLPSARGHCYNTTPPGCESPNLRQAHIMWIRKDYYKRQQCHHHSDKSPLAPCHSYYNFSLFIFFSLLHNSPINLPTMRLTSDNETPEMCAKREAQMQQISDSNATNSPFLRLPPELRNRIYEDIFTSAVIAFRRPLRSHSFCNIYSEPNHKHKGVIAFLEVCRQINHEVAVMYYALSTFNFERYSALQYVGVSYGIPRGKTRKITSIEIPAWMIDSVREPSSKK